MNEAYKALGVSENVLAFSETILSDLKDRFAAIDAIAEAKARHRPVIAVGTTSVRTLEGVAQVCGRAKPFAGWTDIFLYPGRPFRVVDGIITNFHLPESSLLMLVSAFAGRKRILEAYQEAVKEGYRFFSYGDAMLIR